MAWSGLGTVRHVEVCDIDESELAFVDMWTDNSTVVEIAGRSISTLCKKTVYHSCTSRNEKKLLESSGFSDDICMWESCRVDDNIDL